MSSPDFNGNGRLVMEVKGLSNNLSNMAASAPSPAQPSVNVPEKKDDATPAPSKNKPARASKASLKDLEMSFNVKVVMGTDESTGRQVVRIMSQDGKRLLRQMPPDQALQLAARAREGSVRNLLTSLV